MTKTRIAILASVILLLVAPPSFGQQEAMDEASAQAGSIEYPRSLTSDTGTVVVYTPQIDTWKDFSQIEARAAVSVTPAGATTLPP